MHGFYQQPRFAPRLFCVRLERRLQRVNRQVAKNGKERGNHERCVDPEGRKLRPTEGNGAKIPTLPEKLPNIPKISLIAECSVGRRQREHQRSESIEPESCPEVSVQKCGKGAGRTAARTLEMEGVIDGAPWIKAVLRWREAQKYRNGERDEGQWRSRARERCDAEPLPSAAGR